MRPGVRFGEVFRYELRYRLRNPSTWIYAAFLFGIMFVGAGASSDGDGLVKANAPKTMAQGIVLFGGLFGILVSAALFGDAAIRDVAAGMDPLLYTTRLRKSEYLGGRFLATLAINAILVLATPLGFWVATMTTLDANAVGPNRLAAYVQPVLLFTWPNLVLIGALQFTIGTLFRQITPVYIGTAAFFAGYIFAANEWGSIGNPLLSTLADPLGINALLAMTRYWTAADIATQLVGFPPMLLLNRAIWLTIAAGLLLVLHRKFRFAHADGIGWVRRRARVNAEAPVEKRWQGTVPRITGVFDRWTRVHQTIAVARQSLREVISGRGFQAGFLAAIGLTLLWGWNVGDTLFDTSTWPVTHLVVEEVLSRRAPFIPWLVIALYAGELVWKHRETGTAEIADAAPLSTGVALIGRFLALVAIILAFQTALMIGGMLLQTLQGYHNYEPGLYLQVLFGFHLADLVLLAVLAMTVHVLVNQKYIGHIIVLLASAFRIGGPMAGVHRMLVYDSDPGWRYSDMNGFGPYLEPFVWFKAYWASWALLLAAITMLFWIRGTESGVRHRLAQARARFRGPGPAMRMAAAAIALILVIGGFVFHNINILNEYAGRDEAVLPQVEYERRYARFANAPQPAITDADLRVEIYPDTPSADLRGSYRLENRTNAAIDSVHVMINREIDVRSISLDRASSPTVVDKETGFRILTLATPLRPGESMRLSFNTTYRARGFRGTTATPTDVVRNGTYIDRRWLPFVGYQPAFELTSVAARKRLGLAAKGALPAADDADALLHDENLRNEDAVRYEMIVGTSTDQTAVVSAPLRRTWTENGRRYFHYGSDVASRFGASVFSAKYAIAQDRWRDVELQVFHHPGHPQNPRRMIDVMKASLDHYTSTFGPYQFHDLRIVEIPPYSINGRAMATTIAFAEQNFITRQAEGRGDMMFFGTAHEVAHAWWGGQLRGAFAKGRAVLSEALSNYSAMMLTEKLRGEAEARRVYDFQMDRYLGRRSAFERDVPLVEVEDHPHIAYGKGAVAMYTLREQIGADAVNTALRRLLETFRDRGGPPYATASDLVRELRAVTPDELQYLITDLFETVTLWDVKATFSIARRRDDGQFDMSVEVTAKKMRADSTGRETETPMADELVEIGVYGADTDKGPGELLYLQKHRIRAGKQTIAITVPKEPGHAGVDPRHKLIERVRDDNVVEVKCCVIT